MRLTDKRRGEMISARRWLATLQGLLRSKRTDLLRDLTYGNWRLKPEPPNSRSQSGPPT